jgi:hypothetical protein
VSLQVKKKRQILEYSSSYGCFPQQNTDEGQFAKEKGGLVSDPTYLFCNELESITHLFFDYCVATNVWRMVK